MTGAPQTNNRSTITMLFAARGWFLAALLVVVLVARSLTSAPLRPEWLIYVAAAAALRLWAGAHLGAHGNDSHVHAPSLARTGPYRISRNPLYVSNILAATGLILFANALPLPVELALIVLVVLHHIVIVLHEEKILAMIHGADYARYRAHVSRWYGLMRPREPIEQSGKGSRGRVAVSTLLRRQGRNVGYMVLCAFFIWVAT